MEYMGTSTFWDSKFKSRSNKLLDPEQVIVKYMNSFHGSSVLDIACGDGRNSMLFLRQGFKVTGIDFSKEALERLRGFSKGYDDKLNLMQIDLTNEKCLEDIGLHDNAIVCHYRLNNQQLAYMKNLVNPNGTLLITGFSESHVCDERIGKNELIYKSDMDVLLDDFTIAKVEDITDNSGSFVTYILTRNNR